MTSPVIDGVLEQMRGLAAEARGGSERIDLKVGGGFADALHDSLKKINRLQNASGEISRAFQSGEPGVALHDVMIASQKASIAFEMGVQVRNRLVTAYKDIMNMQI
ncbi:flagellar hook-basal body complex protein FliE [Microbulbifer thermotolerans]|uniref:Flagellar hook-basal body complex protein FliE n=1 Tax=Microbulbifer thermotolerans TaxID=252514 RepID=A0A143HN96_MICTH|nr:flagellar hook-basal body complex protein FliE [Microbulbifer thermotolerans]AMX03168.1 flagellar hook-basal body complex protein FliE [Microbulbifer thermotolerans]MCX2783469.1 flagellar hook-basal body complex protein FliE [Microbulbifer thermotolerans]MCX2795863.1 flagellar hook-basal body complex protein FliE [Microbulbifer thermotolerans]MCX2835521.1 flagellar hook-basal body complex protein FliE [Microbulbifer thermotolerans]WKT59733.1 flagellar hook-basal body complex protein FliE [M